MLIEVDLPLEHQGGPALLLEWLTREGGAVRRGDVLLYLMDQEGVFPILAPAAGQVFEIFASEGDEVDGGDFLATIEA